MNKSHATVLGVVAKDDGNLFNNSDVCPFVKLTQCQAVLSIGFGPLMGVTSCVGVVEFFVPINRRRLSRRSNEFLSMWNNMSNGKLRCGSDCLNVGTSDWNVFGDILCPQEFSVRNNTNLKETVSLKLYFGILFVIGLECFRCSGTLSIGRVPLSSYLFIEVVHSMLEIENSSSAGMSGTQGSGYLLLPQASSKHANAKIILDISESYLSRGIVCVDLADIAHVLNGKVSIGLFVSCEMSSSLRQLDELIEINYELLSKSPGVVAVISYPEEFDELIEHLDIIATAISSAIPSSSALFFSVNTKNVRNEFSCSVVANI